MALFLDRLRVQRKACKQFVTHSYSLGLIPVGTYIYKVNNKNTRTKWEICSKLTIKTPKRRQDQWC